MAELVKVHSKALMPSFGDGKEDQRAIEVLTKEITDLLRKSEKRLRKLSSNGSSEDSNLRKNVQVIIINFYYSWTMLIISIFNYRSWEFGINESLIIYLGRTCGRLTDKFSITIRVHQGSALSNFHFAIVMDEITKNIHEDILWCMLFTDDIVLWDQRKG